tara:strand:- start:51 stop:452 length:402 start_codon:yes stop_codon:yes gene_type:complete
MDEFLYLISGFITGVSVGSVGIGAGSLLMPILIMLGTSVKTAVATGLAIQLLPQSLPGLWLYYKNGHFDMKISLWVVIGSLIGTTYGSYIVNYNYLSEKVIYIILFIMMVLSTVFIGYDAYTKHFNFIVHVKK